MTAPTTTATAPIAPTQIARANEVAGSGQAGPARAPLRPSLLRRRPSPWRVRPCCCSPVLPTGSRHQPSRRSTRPVRRQPRRTSGSRAAEPIRIEQAGKARSMACRGEPAERPRMPGRATARHEAHADSDRGEHAVAGPGDRVIGQVRHSRGQESQPLARPRPTPDVPCLESVSRSAEARPRLRRGRTPRGRTSCRHQAGCAGTARALVRRSGRSPSRTIATVARDSAVAGSVLRRRTASHGSKCRDRNEDRCLPAGPEAAPDDGNEDKRGDDEERCAQNEQDGCARGAGLGLWPGRARGPRVFHESLAAASGRGASARICAFSQSRRRCCCCWRSVMYAASATYPANARFAHCGHVTMPSASAPAGSSWPRPHDGQVMDTRDGLASPRPQAANHSA